MSPKMCSLAYDENALYDEDLNNEEVFNPQLEVIVSKKMQSTLSLGDDVVQVRGEINVSF